jgi:hypothetical protein
MAPKVSSLRFAYDALEPYPDLADLTAEDLQVSEALRAGQGVIRPTSTTP